MEVWKEFLLVSRKQEKRKVRGIFIIYAREINLNDIETLFRFNGVAGMPLELALRRNDNKRRKLD